MEGQILADQLRLETERKRFNRVGLAFFAFTLISFVAAQIASSIYIGVYEAKMGEQPTAFPSWFTWTVSIVALYIIAAPITYGLLRLTPKQTPARRKLSGRAFFYFTAIAFFLMIVGSYIGNLINQMLSVVTGAEQGGDVSDVLMNSDLWLSVVYTGIIAPVVEELFFRKLLIDRLHGAGDGIIMIVSGVMFGLFHGNIEQFCYAALLGALLAYVYLHTGNLLYCILIHGIINLFGGLIPMFLYALGSTLFAGLATETQELYMILLSLASAIPQYVFAILGLVFFIIYFKGLKKQIRPGYLSLGKVSGAAFGNAGMILFLVACGLQILLTIILM